MGSIQTEEQALFLKKWAGFVTAMWLMVFSGNYAYANYSEALKEVLGINQEGLNGLSIAKDIGDSCGGILAGILSNYMPPWSLLCISASVGFLGYGAQWLVVSDTINPPAYWTIAIAAMAGGMCISWMNTVIFNASMRNFSRNRGPVAGLFKACMGLSGAVFSVLCSTLFSNSASMYLLMLVIMPSIFCLVSAIFFRPVATAMTQDEERIEQKSLFIYTCIASALAIFIAFLDIISDDLDESSAYQSVSVLMLITIIASPAFVPLLLIVKMKRSENPEGGSVFAARKDQEEGITHHEIDIIKPVADDSMKNALRKPLLDANGDSSRRLFERKIQQRLACWWWCSRLSSSTWIVRGLGEDTPTLSLFKTWHYYVLYFSLFCGCGSGVAFFNNLGQVGESLGFSSVSLFVSLFSLGNFFGRIVSGNISEHYIRVAGIPRPTWMGLAKVPMIVSYMWLSTGSIPSLYAGSLVLGFCHGCLVTLTIPIVSEFYGLKHFSTNFVLTATYLVAGSYVFSSMAGYLYDRQASLEGDLTCNGSECYSIIFRVLASFLTIALGFDALLTVISGPLYQNLRVVSTAVNTE